ncbi:hypothetical protein GWI33_021707 [Rhynchophorus ferrugineus]|uniref:Phospholipase A2 n=1 Tax=Rhynchophorus ferrugineus TaxID=354439 RepID=A0A834IP09_RHYFE|nr:hypothetical protein GWI33_021707 [Rhynchophorus ferrugineus]
MKSTTQLIIPLILTFMGKTNGFDTEPIMISDSKMDTIIELSTKQPYCNIRNNKDVVQIDIRFGDDDDTKLKIVSENELKQFIEICHQKVRRINSHGSFSFPGTKWCGPGDTARNITDLGRFSKEDGCCREHDACSRYIYAGDCRGGICNNTPYTRSHCDCDEKFKKCLQDLKTPIANLIGEVFFNIVGIVCFKEQPPCVQQGSKTEETLIDEEIMSYFNINDPACKLQYSRASRFQQSNVPIDSLALTIQRKQMYFLQCLFRNTNY